MLQFQYEMTQSPLLRSPLADKACGPDGIAPGVFRLLPAQWLLHITALFSLIFTTAQYSALWTRAKFGETPRITEVLV